MEGCWWKESVVYQVYTRSFMDGNGDGIGDLAGIRSRLDYLESLGIGIIWLNPVYRSPNDDNGYDISDYREIMEEFGTMEEFDALLGELHARGMRLIMDLVVNHSSDEHRWFQESRRGKENPYRDYYFWRPGREGGPPNNWRSFFEGPAWDFDERSGEYYLHLFSRKQPDLNWENPAVREEVAAIIRFWLEKGVDGFRMDVINLISKRQGLPDGTDGRDLAGHEHFANGPRLPEYLGYVKGAMAGFDAMTVGETIMADLDTIAGYVDRESGYLDMAINFEHVSLDRGNGSFDPIPLDHARFKATLSAWQRKLDGRGWNCLYLSNHDQPRQVSRFGDDGRHWRESATMLATLLHTLQGTPFIMQGEELGMTNVAFDSIDEYRDIATLNYYRERLQAGDQHEEILRRVHVCSRDNARTPMQWDDSHAAGFTTSAPWIGVNPNYTGVNAAAQEEDPDSILNYYRRLTALRRKHPVLVYGSFEEIADLPPTLYAYRRRYGNDMLTAILNLSDETPRLLNATVVSGGKLLISNYPQPAEQRPDRALRPYEALVLLSGADD